MRGAASWHCTAGLNGYRGVCGAEEHVGSEVRIPVLIHVGYPKTASTWLQEQLFARGDTGLTPVADASTIKRLLAKPHSLWYDPEAVRRALQPRIDEALRQQRVPVLSYELLVGHPVAGGYGSAEIAVRLKDLWPDARIFIAIREQHQMLLSLYAEYATNSGPLSLRKYLDPPGGNRQPVFDLRYLEFHRLIEHYQRLFGADRVLVLPYEAFAQDPLAFCNRLLEFAGCPPVAEVNGQRVRASRGAATITIRSILNRFVFADADNYAAFIRLPLLKGLLDRLDRWWPDRLQRYCKRRMQQIIAARVQSFFAASNRRTSQLIGVDLAAYGYSMPNEDGTASRHGPTETPVEIAAGPSARGSDSDQAM